MEPHTSIGFDPVGVHCDGATQSERLSDVFLSTRNAPFTVDDVIHRRVGVAGLSQGDVSAARFLSVLAAYTKAC